MPKGNEETNRDVGVSDIPDVCEKGHAAVSLVQLQENLALGWQGRIWQSAGK